MKNRNSWQKFFIAPLFYFIFMYIAFHSYNTYAAATCSRLFDATIKFDLEPGLAPDIQKPFEQIIYQTNQMVEGYLKYPEAITLKIELQGSDASFDWNRTIHIPYQYGEGNLVKAPKFSENILLHEYWHSIFSANLRVSTKLNSFQKYEKDYALALENDALGRQTALEYEAKVVEKSKIKRQNPPDPDLMAKLDLEIRDLEDLMDKQEEFRAGLIKSIKNSNFDKIPLVGYHELFADTGTVLYTGDPRVVALTLSFEGQKEKNSGRSFMNRIRLRGWSETEPHLLFAPTRSFIWKYILNTPEGKNQKGLVIKRIFLVIENEIQEQYELAERGIFHSPEELNHRLMKALAQQFGLHLIIKF